MKVRPVLSGKLQCVTLPDLFQILAGNGSSGILRLNNPWIPFGAEIRFHRGEPHDALAGDSRGLEALNALFGWVEGTFEFHAQETCGERTIKKNRMEIVLDALRMLDDGLIPKVGFLSGSGERRHEAETPRIAYLPLIKAPILDYSPILHEEAVPLGQRIVSEGAHGNWIWLVLEGRVLISRDTPLGPYPLVRLGEGSFLGTFEALVFGGHARGATVTALSDVYLGLVDSQRLSAEFRSLSDEFRGLLLNMSRRLKTVTDQQVELFTRLENESHLVKRPRAASPGWDMDHNTLPSSILIPEDLKQGLDIERLQLEYSLLSRTFRNLLHYIGSSIYVTAREVCERPNQKGQPDLGGGVGSPSGASSFRKPKGGYL